MRPVPNITAAHVKWAQQHDWFVRWDWAEPPVSGKCRPIAIWVRGGLSFKSYSELRSWAGY